MPAQPAVPPSQAALAACKRPIEVALEIAETVVEATEKACEIQLAAAVDAHAALEATRKSLESATSLPELVEAQMRLATGNLGSAFAYWSSLAGNARDLQMRVATILGTAPAVPSNVFASFNVPSFILPGLKVPEKAA